MTRVGTFRTRAACATGAENRRLAPDVGQLRPPRRETQCRALLLRAAAARAADRFFQAAPDSPAAVGRQGQNALDAPDVGQLRERWEHVRAEILAAPERFLEQGTVRAKWRTRNGRRFGPYFHLVYRADGRDQAIYLGTSEVLAQAVRDLLEDLRRPLERERAMRRCRKHATALLKSDLRRLQGELAAGGPGLPRWQVRGLRRVIRSLRAVVRPRARELDDQRGDFIESPTV